ncbi:hypothetical protein O3M35_010935 [Rhynocoris fuscipes]|uniref:RING-CH-type domain-containing protein n=1 Tax=Rhynocoris fuscipes TaxID=488301 RepID=A0AAW1D698_9HEMI
MKEENVDGEEETEIPTTTKVGGTTIVKEQNGGGSTISLCACRICQTAKSKEALISPCYCKGTLGKVHLSCLERWLNMCGRQHCEICRYQFQAKRKKRYGICQAIRIWLRHPAHRMLMKSDLIVACILTTVTMGLCSVSIFGLKYFVEEGQKIGVPSVYTKGVLIMFLAVILIGYITTLYLMAKDHVIPWYRWWSRCLVIKIIVSTTRISDEELIRVKPESSNRKSTLVPPKQTVTIATPPIQP